MWHCISKRKRWREIVQLFCLQIVLPRWLLCVSPSLLRFSFSSLNLVVLYFSPEHLWIISSSLVPFVNSTITPHNERRRKPSLRGSILSSDSIMTIWLINVPDYVPSRHSFFPSVPSDLTANYNPPALLYERQIRRPFHFLLRVLNMSSRREVIMALFHL